MVSSPDGDRQGHAKDDDRRPRPKVADCFVVQMARFRDYIPFGYWTVCIHPNIMSSRDLERLVNDLRRMRTIR
jgi:hypothetical protein